ncbi:DUF1642 domain-containing protein [Aerococcaceae bacterium NML160702]|nr:DUF1642 domain-containing protein [Aerococcaceae bacterium NML160702]
MRIWHTKTQEDYDYLMGQLGKEGCTWGRTRAVDKNLWRYHKEQTCVREENGLLGYCKRAFYEKEYPNVKIQPVVLPDHLLVDTFEKLIAQDGENKQLQKVVIPKEIAEWIEEAKTNYLEWNDHSKGNFIIRCVYDLFQYGEGKPTYDFDINDMISEWSKDNPYTFVRAIIDGYEVEKEKVYTVVLPNIESSKYSRDYYLQRSEIGEVHLAKGRFEIRDNTKLTEAEIKSVDERYMAFAQEVQNG